MGPVISLVFASTRACTGLLPRKVARSVPVGANCAACSVAGPLNRIAGQLKQARRSGKLRRMQEIISHTARRLRACHQVGVPVWHLECYAVCASMKIARVEAYLLSYPFPEPILMPFHGGDRMLLKRDAMLIRVETEDGVVGYAPGPGSERAQALVSGVIAPFLVGRRLKDPDALRVQFLGGSGCDPDVAKIYGAVEIALYDLAGKALGMPVSELLGGRVRDRIRLYASAGMYLSPEAHASEAAAIRDLGFRAYKMRIAQGP